MRLLIVFYLLLGASLFTISLVLQLAFIEAYQAAVWLLYFTLYCCSLAYTEKFPHLHRDVVVIAVGVITCICTVLAACAFAAGLATKTIDRVAFGLGLSSTIFGLP